MKEYFTPKSTLVLSLILLAICSRFLPHPPNFTAVGASALFSAAIFPSIILALLIPVSAMIITDIYLGFHHSIWSVYIAILIISGIGILLRGKISATKVFGASLAGSVIFFILTNYAAWLTLPMYAKDVPGLMESYFMAIPFFGNTVAGDLFYNGILFGTFYLVTQRFPAFAK